MQYYLICVQLSVPIYHTILLWDIYFFNVFFLSQYLSMYNLSLHPLVLYCSVKNITKTLSLQSIFLTWYIMQLFALAIMYYLIVRNFLVKTCSLLGEKYKILHITLYMGKYSRYFPTSYLLPLFVYIAQCYSSFMT